jgi:glutamate carboxypeptidase
MTAVPLRPRATWLAALGVTLALLGPGASLGQQSLKKPEVRIRDHVRRTADTQVALLQRVVDIPSGTLNVAGVRRVGDVFRGEFEALGFKTRWVEMPPEMGRAGHLVAEHAGKPGALRVLLIGHLDTVYEGPGQGFVRDGPVARGAGSLDMKGGDVIILTALRALKEAGALADLHVTVVFTGDEESVGEPIAVARQELIEAARRSDVALAFEAGFRDTAVVARRGSSSWRLTVTGKQAHSSGIFGESAGHGAIFESARILDDFRRALAGEQYLTFNPGVMVGGTEARLDERAASGTASGKDNIVAGRATVSGDLRFLSEEQKERARTRMREIVSRSLPGTSAEIAFTDEYPAMSPTPGNSRLLAVYDAASQALGHGKVEAFDPGKRGAGDISFVAPLIDSLDGLGAIGSGSHSPREEVQLASLTMQAERTALLLYRLSRQTPGLERAPPPPSGKGGD